MCTNTEGSYVCRCIKNFEGDGRNCTGKTTILFSLFSMLVFMSNFKSFFLPAVTIGCIPSCGPNAVCQKNEGLPKCVCNFGYQGDGYNCAGSGERESLCFLLLLTLPFNLRLFFCFEQKLFNMSLPKMPSNLSYV